MLKNLKIRYNNKINNFIIRYLYAVLQVNLEQSAMEEILKFGEFSSLLNKSHSANSTNKSENAGNAADDGKKKEARRDEDDSSYRDKDNHGCQVENGQDIV